MTIGEVAMAPKTLALLIEKRHFTFSWETFCELIADWVVARVFERSWLWAGHEPALAAHSGGGWPTADASPAAGELPAQPTRARTATRAPKTATPALPQRILFVNDMVERLPSSSGTWRKVAARA